MVKKWDIVFISLNPVEGSEQGGKRPALVISNDGVNKNLPIITCIPFSSVKDNELIYPTEVYFEKEELGLNKDSVLMLHQIRTISKNRIIGKISEVKKDEYKRRIEENLKKYFELD